MKKIAIFSVNAQYKIGGAETCINQMAEILSGYYDVTVISGERSQFKNQKKYIYKKAMSFPLYNIKYLNYLGNFINYFFIYKFFKEKKFDVVIGNCSTCIGAINATKKNGRKVIYYVHEEFSLNKRPEYSNKTSLKSKLLKLVRQAVDYPFFIFHCKKNLKALSDCDKVISNSNYISLELLKLKDIKSEIIFPFTQTAGKLKTDINQAKYITMIGSGEVKGISTFLKLAKLMPNEQFRVVGRNLKLKQVDNVLYHPFYEDTNQLYSSTKMLLVPSIWQEAFGKVSLEASSHAIPVIVSKRGGLPETVCSDELIIEDYLCENAWFKKVEKINRELEFWGDKCSQNALKFDLKFDEIKLKKILEEIIGE